jgi:membrane protein YdbS with pleckstrin-like domain
MKGRIFMAKSNWEKANIIVIIILLVITIANGVRGYFIIRNAQRSIFNAGTVAFFTVALHFGIFYGIFCLIRWIAKGYRAKEPTGTKPEQKQ